MMLIFDLLLLALTLAVLFVICAARMRGKLPHRGLRRVAQFQSPRVGGAATSPKGATKPDNFRGILVHHDRPVQFLPLKYTTS